MENDNFEQISGVVSAQKFLIQNLYALILAQQADPLVTFSKMSSDITRMFEALPANDREFDDDVDGRVRQHGLQYLKMFWSGVGARLEAHTRKRRH